MSLSNERKEEPYFCTNEGEIVDAVKDARINFNKSLPTSYEYRIQQIQQLSLFLDECEDVLTHACQEYFGGSAAAHWVNRFFLCKYECNLAIKQLKTWMKPLIKSQPFPVNLMWNAEVQYHPRGVCCIIGAWNFPISLLIRPLIGAITAGNAVIIKPSEVTDAVARCISQNLCAYLDPKMIKVVCGGASQTILLLQQQLDFVFFTGGSNIGRIISKQCAENLVPFCLELGGKNPVLIDDDCNLDTSMKRIVSGRFDTNGGQVCVAPEYIFISKSAVPECIACIKKHLLSFYSTQKMQAQNGTDSYNTIVNDNHFKRLNTIRNTYLDDEQLYGKVVIGNADDMRDWFGKPNENTRYIPPMVLSNVDYTSDPIMESEVFGPILSIIPMDGRADEWRDEAIAYIQSKDKPLVCYVFSKNDSFIKYCNVRIIAGAVVGNDTVQYLGLHDVPFGGIGGSGCGRYCGRYSFITFSHEKPLAIRAHGREFFERDRYPVAGKDRTAKLKRYRKTLERFYPKKSWMGNKLSKLAIFVVVVSVCTYVYYRRRYQ